MRWSDTYIQTLREAPQEAEIRSHRLMIRAGLIQKVSSGLYTFLPLGLKALRKIEKIIREELDKHGAIEVLMPILQPKEIWMQSGRWKTMRDLMLVAQDRQSREFVLGPTHEEVITDLVSKRLKSYRDLPKNFYQIQIKFRDEIRPRFGLMRAREFLMKDGYSFDSTDEAAQVSYWNMVKAYQAIFDRCGLKYKMVEADTGVMGGSLSHEFMVLAETGEDEIFSCLKCGYAANRELAVRLCRSVESVARASPSKVATPNLKSVEEVSKFLSVSTSQLVKTLIYWVQGHAIAVLSRGDIQINERKLCRFLGVSQIELASEEKIVAMTGAPLGFAGPVGLKDIPIYADFSVKSMHDAITGANEADTHLVHVDIQRDCAINTYGDFGFAQKGDLCSKCELEYEVNRGIEVGHVFKLGTKYSKSFGATFLNEQGVQTPCIMGCYGIGVSRTLAAFVEQNSSEEGIVWSKALAPYEIIILPLLMEDEKIRAVSNELYNELAQLGYDVLLDDRNDRPGVKFKDADLIGSPFQITLGQKFLETGSVEIYIRKGKEREQIPLSDIKIRIKEIFNHL